MLATGLALLIYNSVTALQVTLRMSIGSFALGAVNFPGPKLIATGVVQRSLGNQPGEWGVAGTTAMLLEIVGIWMLTERRAQTGDAESASSLRLWTRWSAVVLGGALLGAGLSGAGAYIPPMGNDAGGLLVAAVVVVELPANTLLFLHMRQLARRLGSRRALALLGWLVWCVPALILGGGGLMAVDILRTSSPPQVWHLVTGGYGVAAVACAAAATAATLQLLSTLIAAGFGSWAAASRDRMLDAGQQLRRAADVVDRNLAKWCVVAGLLLWVTTVSANIQTSLWQSKRVGLLGNVPALNFAGPKIAAPVDLQSDATFDRPENFTVLSSPTVASLAAVWLMTVRLRSEKNSIGRRVFRTLARWLPTLLVAIPIGVRLALWADADHPAPMLAMGVGIAEIPATVLTYLYLSSLAKRVSGPWRTLLVVACVMPFVAGLPMVALVLSARLVAMRTNPGVAAVASVLVAASLALSFLAASGLFRLAWQMARWKPEETRSARGEFEKARA